MSNLGYLRSIWRWPLFLCMFAFLVVGVVTIANTGDAFGLIMGAAGVLLGGLGVWRSLVMGVKVLSDRVQVRRFEGSSSFRWCDVKAIGSEKNVGTIFGSTITPVLQLRSGDVEWLTSLSAYSISSNISRRMGEKIAKLERALAGHRENCQECVDGDN